MPLVFALENCEIHFLFLQWQRFPSIPCTSRRMPSIQYRHIPLCHRSAITHQNDNEWTLIDRHPFNRYRTNLMTLYLWLFSWIHWGLCCECFAVFKLSDVVAVVDETILDSSNCSFFLNFVFFVFSFQSPIGRDDQCNRIGFWHLNKLSQCVLAAAWNCDSLTDKWPLKYSIQLDIITISIKILFEIN